MNTVDITILSICAMVYALLLGTVAKLSHYRGKHRMTKPVVEYEYGWNKNDIPTTTHIIRSEG